MECASDNDSSLLKLSTLSSLSPYSGPWTHREACHLLRRCTIGATKEQIDQVLNQGLESTVEQLFENIAVPFLPLNYDNSEDPNVALGETWVDELYTPGVFLWGYRSRSLRAWTMEMALKEGISIRETLTLFWQNHFAISQIVDANFLFIYINKLRLQAWGNFKQLIKDITIDPSMLIFLDGHNNTKTAPNENYARELLELFTIGKGPLAGPGDYTHFTEHDVHEISRVLTGWKDQGFLSGDVPVSPFFYPYDHDSGEKQLSHRFNNAIIPNLGDQEYAHLIDIIFEQDEVARFICRKLYRWFVSNDIDNFVEMEIIEPMAQILRENNYEIKPALKALISSEHFFQERNIGQFIKHPFNFTIAPLKKFHVQLPEDNLQLKYTILLKLYSLNQQIDMDYFNPPEVSGWPAFHQVPLYHRVWISANNLRYREEYSSIISQNGYNFDGYPFRVNVLGLISILDNPLDINNMIEEIEQLFLPHPLEQSQRDELKHILIPGLPDFEWTVEISNFQANPEDQALAQALEQRLRLFFRYFFRLPEYYLY
jgi:hypothetical protein